ncbi:MAG: DUF6198 family protein [Bifidobacterium sp.]|nr:DUF6198 family protein [Bifidobacterium sp.]
MTAGAVAAGGAAASAGKQAAPAKAATTAKPPLPIGLVQTVVGLSLLALGAALSMRADLGTSAISCIPFVVSQFTPVTVGVLSMALQAILVISQVIILRRDAGISQVLQIPVAFFIGFMIDVWVGVVKVVPVGPYWSRAVVCVVSVACTALGVALFVHGGITCAPAEGFALAVSTRTGISFPVMKTVTDVSMAVIAVLVGFVAMGRLAGVREGTVLAVLCVGFLSKQFSKLLFRDKSTQHAAELPVEGVESLDASAEPLAEAIEAVEEGAKGLLEDAEQVVAA